MQDSATAVCPFQELHSKDSLRHLPMEPNSDTGGKATKKLSFCPFCLYHGSNDLSYVNHIMCGHYHANYSCEQCLKEVFLLGQQLKNHLKICMGFAKTGTPSFLRRSLCPRVPRRAARQANTVASIQRRRNQTPPRGPVGKVPSPRCTRSPNAARRCLRRRSITGRTKQTRASLTSSRRSESCGWHASDVHPFAALHAKGGTSVIPKVFQL